MELHSRLIAGLACFALATTVTSASEDPATRRDVPPPPAIDRAEHLARALGALGAKDPAAVERGFRAADPARLFHDVDRHGALWVRGSTYKASFDARGATYIPFLGSQAPRNFPLKMSLASAQAGGAPLELLPARGAAREDERVVIDRGPIAEVYELGLESVEQTFVVAQRPVAGDLRLRIAIDTELAAAEAADGFTFSNEYGGVRYGSASIRAADGALTAVPTRLVEGGIEIVVPAERLAVASFPLVVDPVISTFAAGVFSPFDDLYPDVAYDATSDHYLIVMQDAFSAGDYDVYARIVDATGAYVDSQYVDQTAEVWYLPKCANNDFFGRFLVVATTGNIASSTNRRVEARWSLASALSWSAVIDVSGGQTDYNLYPDVGGDRDSGLTFLVAWQRTVGGLEQIAFRRVSINGVLQGANPTVLHSASDVKDAAVSNSSSGGVWNVAWDRCPSSSFDCDVWAARVDTSGNVDNAPFTVSNVAQVNYAPSVSTSLPNGQYMIAWRKEIAGNDDIECAVLSGGSVQHRANLTALQAVQQDERQVGADVDATDDMFVVGWAESYEGSSTDYDPYVASFVVLSGTIALAEGHQDLAFTSRREDQVALFSEYSGGTSTGRVVCVWRDDSGSTALNDIRGAFYDTPLAGAKTPLCFGDGSGTACPCGNSGGAGRGCASSIFASGARLSATGNARVTADTLVLSGTGLPNAACLFFQGTSVSNGSLGSAFGDGLRCATGTIARLGTKTASGNAAAYPQAGDQDVSVRGAVPASGAVRYYQLWYRNAAAFCTASTFNLSNGLRVTWLP